MEYKLVCCFVLICSTIHYSTSDGKTCIFKEGSNIHVTCDVANGHSSSVLWQITEQNQTTTLYNCTLSACKLVNGSNINLIATTKVDSTNNFIVSSSLNGQVDSISQNTSIRNLRCQINNTIVDVCENIEVYADPKNATCYLGYITSDMILVECIIYPVSAIGIVITPDLKTNNVSRFDSTIINDDCVQKNSTTLGCEYVFNQTKMGAGNHQFSLTVSANVSDTNKTFVTSNTVDIFFWDGIQYVVCLEPEVNPKYSSLYTVKCLTPLPIGDVNCTLNQKTNNTFVRSYVRSQRQHEYFPDQNILKTFALECQFRLFLSDFLPGHHEFQGNFSTVTSDGIVSFKTSNWTSWILRYQSQMNFTVNGSAEGDIVKLNDSLFFHCSTDSTLSPMIKLQQGNLQFPFMYDDVAEFNGTELSFPVTSCQQAGLYYCGSYGELSGDTLRKNVSVKIICPQRLRSKYFQPANKQYVGTFDNTNTVEIPVIGYPSPNTMTLMKQQEPTKTSIVDGVIVTYKVDSVSPYGNIFVIFSNEGIISKMTNFTLTVNNGIYDDTLFEFSIRARNTAASVGGKYGVLSLILCIILLH